jgi:MraZ protein
VFYGTYQHAIDAKGRTSLPARFREVLSAKGEPKVFLMPSPGMKALRAVPLSMWRMVEEQLAKVSPFDLKKQQMILRFISPAHEVDLDVHGRVLVPPNLRAYAGLEKEVVWAGAIRDVTLWDRGTWEAQQATPMAAEEIVDPFAGLA